MKKRRQLRKWGLACLVMALLVCSLPGTYAAAVDPSVIVFDTVESAQVGDTIALDIDVTDANYNVTDGKLVIRYDGTALEYVSAEQGEAWTEGTTLEYEVNPDTSGRAGGSGLCRGCQRGGGNHFHPELPRPAGRPHNGLSER